MGERQNLLKIWCGTGDATKFCTGTKEEPEEVQVPVIFDWDEDEPCFVGRQSAGCLLESDRFSSEGVYREILPKSEAPLQSVFRSLVREDSVSSALRMRLLAAAVASAVLTVVLILMAQRGAGFFFAWLVVGLPTFFSVAHVTPEGWLTLAAPLMVIGSHMVFSRPLEFKSQKTSLTGFTAWLSGGLLAVLAGTESVLVMVVATLGGALLSSLSRFERERTVQRSSSYSISGSEPPVWTWAVLLLALTLTALQLMQYTAIFQIFSSSRLNLLLVNFLLLPDFVIGFLGGSGWPIGFGDVPLPWTGTLVAVFAVVVYLRDWKSATGQFAKRLIGFGFVLFLFCVLALQVSTEEIFRSERSLVTSASPYVASIATLAALSRSRGFSLRTKVGLCISILAVASLYLRRVQQKYVSGLQDRSDSSLHCLWCQLEPREWWWNEWFPRALSPEATWAIGLIGLAGCLFLVCLGDVWTDSVHQRRKVLLATAVTLISTSFALRLTSPWL